MRATFSFNLPEEQTEFDIFRKAPSYAAAIDDLYQYLRAKRKYGHLSDAEQAVYDEIWHQFHAILSDRDLQEW